MKTDLQLFLHKQLLFQIHEARCITMDDKRLEELLDKIDAWCFAHNCSNGQLSDEECKEEIKRKLKKFNKRYI